MKEIDRTEFLKLLGVAGLAVASIPGVITFASTKDYLGTHRKIGMGKRLAMVIDLRRCTGCRACQVACKAEFNVPLGVWRSWVKYVERGSYPNVKLHFLPRLCNHCDDPPCVSVCPTKASYKRGDGVVLINYDMCIGCKYCIPTCPYESRFFNPLRKTADKCTFCIHRVDEGIVPACVNTCRGRARIFGDLNDKKSEVSRLLASESVQVLEPSRPRPKVYYIGLDRSVIEAKGGGR